MPDNAYGQAVQAGLAALVLLLMLIPILKSSFVELFKQRIFGLRRAMFIDHVDGVIAADRAYRLMTDTMNGVLRYAEHVTFGRGLFGLLFGGRADDNLDEVEIEIEMADEASRERLRAYRSRLHYEIARHMLLTSPLLWCLILAILPLVVVLVALRVLGIATDGLASIVSRVGRLSAVRRLESDARALLPEDADDVMLVA